MNISVRRSENKGGVLLEVASRAAPRVGAQVVPPWALSRTVVWDGDCSDLVKSLSCPSPGGVLWSCSCLRRSTFSHVDEFLYLQPLSTQNKSWAVDARDR